MGANTTVYVKVIVQVEKWVEVQAVTTEEAKDIVRRTERDLIDVIGAQYDMPACRTSYYQE